MAKPVSSQSKPTALLTQHVFLDTQVYRQLGHNPNNPVLRTLGSHIKHSGLVLHITDITFSEIRRQLREFTGVTAQMLKAARKEYGRWRHRLPSVVPHDLPAFDDIAAAEAAYDELFKAAKHDWEATFHVATSVAALGVFQDYFERRPPFSKQESKEFPDAFVVKCLEQWCAEIDERMYVVTADKAMVDAVNDAPHLIHAKTLEDVFASIAATDTPDIWGKVEKLLAKTKIVAATQTAVEADISDLIPVYVGDLADGEVNAHDINGNIEIVDFKVIAVSDKEVSVIMEIRTPLLITIDYDDRSNAIYDKEDDIYFGAETAETEFEDDPLIRVFAKYSLRPAKLATLRILTNEVNVSDPIDDYR